MQIAAIIDEYGGTARIVTLQKLVEEMVGRLTEESVTERPLIEIEERTMQIEGLMRIGEVNEELGIQVPEDDNYETVAGFILYQLRHIPREGEQFRYNDPSFTVQEIKGPKIEKVLTTKE